MIWRDLHIDLEKDVTNKSTSPELTVKGISFERVICDKLWKVTSPQAYKEGQYISATNLDAYVRGENDQTKIKARSANYHMTDQVFNFAEATVTSVQNNNEYNVVANNLSFEAQRKKWNIKGNVCASSKEILIKTNTAILHETSKTCEMPNGGKIIWKEKR